jgi:hypothetical protein
VQNTSGKTCGLSPETVEPQAYASSVLLTTNRQQPTANRIVVVPKRVHKMQGSNAYAPQRNRRSKYLPNAASLLSGTCNPPSNRKPQQSLCNRSAVPYCRRPACSSNAVPRTTPDAPPQTAPKPMRGTPQRPSSLRPARLARHAPPAEPQYRASRAVPCRETVISRTAGRQRLPLPPEQGLRPTRLHSPSHHSPACALSPSLLCSWLMALGSYTDGLLPHTTIASGGSTPSVAAVGLATGGVQLMGPSSRSVLALTFSEKATLRSTGCIPAM